MKKFWDKVRKSKGCWNFIGSVGKDGYGKFYIDGKMEMAHRVSYKIKVGEIPKGLNIDHKCRNRACVNPKHIEPVTQRENVMRGLGVARFNSEKTHCIHGHEFNYINTRITKDGERACRVCARLWARKNRKSKCVS